MSKKTTKQRMHSGNKKFVAVLIFTLIIGVSATLMGCSLEKATTIEVPKAQQVVSTEKVEPRKVKEQRAFYKIAVAADRSDSVESTRTPPLTMVHLESLIAFVREKSGEIAFGFVDEDSNQPFLRLRIDPRPVAPMQPDAKNNPFEQEKLLDLYKIRMRDFQRLDKKWQAETNRRIEEFKTAAQVMIACLDDKKCRSKSTDVTEAVKRADLFLAEDEKIPPVCVMLLVTDGLETAKPKAAPPLLYSQPHILIVNGSASLGILESYQPVAFEGIDAAVRHITRIQPPTERTAAQVSTSTVEPKARSN